MPIHRDQDACYQSDKAVCVGGIFGVAGKANGPAGSIWSPTRRAIRDAGRGGLVSMRPESGNEEISGALHEVARREEDVNTPDLARPDGIGSKVMPMDQRELGIGSQILRDLGLSKLRLLTNHPRPWPTLHGFGLEVVESVPLG
jgi:3,4-dihydroxy 2-butanone 4-phosphate synthase/GTP cyclohydrolase II